MHEMIKFFVTARSKLSDKLALRTPNVLTKNVVLVDFAVFFKTIDSLLWQGTVRYDRVRYGMLENSDKYALPTVFTT